MRGRLRRHSSILVAAAALSLAGFLVYRILREHSLAELAQTIGAASGGHFAAALGFAAASYLSLTGFDYLALRYAGRPLAWRRAALASFCGLSIGHNLGFAALSSGAIRYRFYSRWGLGAADVAKIIVFCGMTVGLGMGTLGGIALLVRPELAARATGLGGPALVAGGVAILAAVGLYLALCFVRKRPFRIGKWQVALPSPALAGAQIAIGAVNFLCVGACLHQAIAGFAEIPYLSVAAAFLIANTTALISHVPGGLGVIETVLLRLLPGADMLAAVLLFRAAYFLVPLPFGAATFAAWELMGRRRGRRDGAAVAGSGL